ncbi:MAG: B12-binding domain-containing radical SAM protein, partial [Candidatus Hermodarchaeota archaeon]
PDREMWQKWIKYPDSNSHIILAGRGCPYRCTYCHNHAIRKLAPGKYTRLRSVENILQELESLIRLFPNAKEVYFEVETIGVNIEYATDLSSALEKFNAQLQRPLSFGVNFRITANKDFRPLFRALKKGNFSYINIGLESGSERIRKSILRRNYSNTDIIKTVSDAKKVGLDVNTYNMVGLPDETLEDFKKTIALNQACQPKNAWLKIAFPYPGTELHKIFKEKGLLNQKVDARIERILAVADLEGFSKKQILHEFQWFWFNVYKGHRPIQHLLAGVLFWKIHSHPTLHRFYYNFDNHFISKNIKSIMARVSQFRD